MKKLGFLVMSLISVSLLASCGGKPSPTPTEDVKFSATTSVTLDDTKTKANISLNWTPNDHSIECSDFTFTLTRQPSITSTIVAGEKGSRPLNLAITFNSTLMFEDTGELKFHYNDKTANKEGEGKVTGINVKLPVVPPTPTEYDLEVTCTYCTPSGNKIKYEEGEEVLFTITPNPNYELPGKAGITVTGVTDYEYTITSGVATFSCSMPAGKVTVTVTATPITPPTPTKYTLNATCNNGTVTGNEGQYAENADVALTFSPNQDHFLPESVDDFEKLEGIDKSAVTYNNVTGSLTFKMPANLVTIIVTATEPAAVGTIKWTNYDDSLLVDAYELPVDATPKYTGPTPTQPKDTTHVHRFTGWTPKIHKVVKGDNVYKAVYDDVPITNVGAEFKITIPSTNEDKTFTFTCDGSKKLTVDWGDTTVDNNQSHTYKSSGTYNISIYREDITNVNVTDSTSKSYITEIKFKDKITSIANDAFSSCANLTSVNISKNVTSIGTNVFSGCNALSTIVVASDNSIYDSRDSCNAIIESATNTLIKGCNKSSIPETVTTIGDRAFMDCSNLKYIYIPDSVISIDNYAFAGCVSVETIYTEITTPSLTSIGDYAFSGCIKLANFIIPNNLLTIGKYAFSDCSGLKSINCYDVATLSSIGDYAFNNCSSLSTIKIPNSVTLIGEGAFDGCSSLTYETYDNCQYLVNNGNKYFALIKTNSSDISNVTINSACKIICSRAFDSCYSLTSITIPSSVVSIGDYAFSYCSQLQTVTFEEGSILKTIGDYAFDSCPISSITIPSSVTSINNFAFRGCHYLQTITFKEGSLLKTIGDYAFDSCSFSSITIPSGVTSIGYGAFYGCSSLIAFAVPSSVTLIGNLTFSGCISLQTVTFEEGSILESIGSNAFSNCPISSITIPSSVTSINNSAFFGCHYLQTVTFEEGSILESIGSNAFSNCPISSITIPSSVTSINNFAFKGCTSLQTVTFEEGSILESIGSSAFDSCSFSSITIPSSVTSIGLYAFNSCTSLQTVTFEEGSILESIGSNVFSNCPISSITIPSSVTSIGLCAFNSCTNLQTVTFEEGSLLKTIGDYAFDSCPISSITIPSGVTSIGLYAFRGCTNLQTVTFEEGSLLETIGNEAFDHCTSLSSITIPSSVTSIGSNAFVDCYNLQTVYLTAFIEKDPNKIPSLGLSPFYRCHENLVFEVANEEMANTFKNSGKGWPTTLDSYHWPDKPENSI